MGLSQCVSATSACSPASLQWLEQINDVGGVGGVRGLQHGWSKTVEQVEATNQKTKASGHPGNVQAGQLMSGWGSVAFLLADADEHFAFLIG